jgi:hypothetical protein
MRLVKPAVHGVIGEPPDPPVRWRLPNRRQTRRVFILYRAGRFRTLLAGENPDHFDRRELYTVDIGYVAGRAGECFADGARAGSEIEALIDDACTAISRELQYGLSPDYLRARYSRNSDGTPSSIFGAILDAIIEDAPLHLKEWQEGQQVLIAVERIEWRPKVPG